MELIGLLEVARLQGKRLAHFEAETAETSLWNSPSPFAASGICLRSNSMPPVGDVKGPCGNTVNCERRNREDWMRIIFCRNGWTRLVRMADSNENPSGEGVWSSIASQIG